jgi:hypothetical protein
MRQIILVVLLNFIALTAHGGQAQATAFRVVIVEGQGALNNIETRAARELAVRVLDSAGGPVAGATVEFNGSGNGAGELFANGSSHFAATTDATCAALIAAPMMIAIKNARSAVSCFMCLPAHAASKARTTHRRGASDLVRMPFDFSDGSDRGRVSNPGD